MMCVFMELKADEVCEVKIIIRHCFKMYLIRSGCFLGYIFLDLLSVFVFKVFYLVLDMATFK